MTRAQPPHLTCHTPAAMTPPVRTDIELEIERVGDELRIRPARRPLAGVMKKFAQFGPDFIADGRGEQEQAEREAL